MLRADRCFCEQCVPYTARLKIDGSSLPDDRLKRVTDYMNGILDPTRRRQCIAALATEVSDVYEIGSFLYWRPGLLSALLLELMKYQFVDVTVIVREYEVIRSIVLLLEKMAMDPLVKGEFLKTGCLLFIYKFLDYAEQNMELEQVRVSILSLLAPLVWELPLTSVERHILRIDYNRYPPTSEIYTKALNSLVFCRSGVGKLTDLLFLMRLLDSVNLKVMISANAELTLNSVATFRYMLSYMAQRFWRQARTLVQIGQIKSIVNKETWASGSHDFEKAKLVFIYAMYCISELCDVRPFRDILCIDFPLQLQTSYFLDLFNNDDMVDTWLNHIRILAGVKLLAVQEDT